MSQRSPIGGRAAHGMAAETRAWWMPTRPAADQQPGATRVAIEFARRWRDMPKVVSSSTISAADWNTRLVAGEAVSWVNLNLVETRTFPDGVVVTRYEKRR